MIGAADKSDKSIETTSDNGDHSNENDAETSQMDNSQT